MWRWCITLHISVNILHLVEATKHKCTSIVTPHFEACTAGDIPTLPKTTCQQHIHMCKRGFNVSFVRLEPLSNPKFSTLIMQILRYCCGDCLHPTVVQNFTSVLEMSPSSINSSHIVYPVLGRSDIKRLYGYHFIPFWDAPGVVYITLKHTKEMVLRRLITSCGRLWPLLISMLMMAIIAGSVIWAIETWVDTEMFSKTFLIGLLDGFWWSFVSMTTVGYGDKIPTFPASRLFSVLWILVGIIMCSMFTASLTREVSSASTPEIPDMKMRLVGVIKHRLYDSALVARQGGIIHETKGLDLISDVGELITKLKGNEISGFVLDKYAYLHTYRYFLSANRTTSNHTDNGYFLSKRTTHTEKTYNGDKLSFGMLVKNYEDYGFLREFVLDNRLHIDTCMFMTLNRIDHSQHESSEHDILSTEGGLFLPFMMVTAAIVVCIGMGGIAYEAAKAPFWRKIFHVSGKKRNPTTTTNTTDTLSVKTLSAL